MALKEQLDLYVDQVASLNTKLNEVKKAITSDNEPVALEVLKNVTYNSIQSIISSELSNFQREILAAVDKRLENISASLNRAQSIRPRSFSRPVTVTNSNANSSTPINIKAVKKLKLNFPLTF